MDNKKYKKFVVIVLILALGGFSLIGVFNYIIDPYNMNGKVSLGLNKQLISLRANYRLYKMIAYEKNPTANILLGDSRVYSIDADFVKQQTGEEYSNLAFGGSSLYEAIETFWYVASVRELKNVYVGINFNIYNKSMKTMMLNEAIILKDSPFKYYTSSFVGKIALYNVIYKLTGRNLISGKPASKDSFWQQQLGNTTRDYYGKYSYPDDLYEKLKQVKAYCDQKNINLVFIIPPTHIDLQNEIAKYHLQKEYARYKQDLSSITTTIDFDYPNKWTQERDLFDDPYHFSKPVMQQLVMEVWKRELKIGKRL